MGPHSSDFIFPDPMIIRAQSIAKKPSGQGLLKRTKYYNKKYGGLYMEQGGISCLECANLHYSGKDLNDVLKAGV